MSTSRKFYLGKQGKTFGPFSPEEIEGFRNTRQIQNYTFIWDTQKEEWNTLESPPPAPGGKTPLPGEIYWNELKVICHDFQQLLSGLLEDVTDSGCSFLTKDSSEYPTLVLKSRVILNLMEPQSEKSMAVEARVAHVDRKQNTWHYRLSWGEKPKFGP